MSVLRTYLVDLGGQPTNVRAVVWLASASELRAGGSHEVELASVGGISAEVIEDEEYLLAVERLVIDAEIERRAAEREGYADAKG